ncbi:MAG: alpha-glucan family phosphorylase, partial [Jatrophihabitans sp.]|uniref:alpha-glucan family phosphorylase n=1 Tax=Jatrophihabitans sp. TaxID=1932789 RepID=UPI003F822D40
PTWMSRDILEIAEREVGPEILAEGGGWEAIDRVSDKELWGVRNTLRERLVLEIRRRMRESYATRGFGESQLSWIDSAFDPEVLTIGFARRVPSYKRLTLMLRDPARLKALLLDEQHPVQIVIAGKSHPADDGGKQLIAQMVRFADDPEVRHRITFLPDYDIGMARYLYWGVDVWLNNPLRPLEACGTSGMKAALNGALNLSIRDGWWDEWFDGENGWAIPSAEGVDADQRDDLEAHALYDLIEKNVATRFYDRDGKGIPVRWVQMVRHTVSTLGPKVLASRMVSEYVRRLYVPASASSIRMASDGFAPAKELAAWRSRVLAGWGGVVVRNVDSAMEGDAAELGKTLSLRATVALGSLSTDDVDVEAVYGPVDIDDRLTETRTVTLKATEPVDDAQRYEGDLPLDRTGAFGYTVRVLPKNELLATPAELGVVATA